MHFTVQRRNGVRCPTWVVLNLPGEHNVLNALSAIAVATELNIPDEAVLRRWPSSRAWAGASSAMASCRRAAGASPDRRLRPPPGGDGRHAGGRARRLPGPRLVLAFQPHRYTRTRDCFEDFVKVIGRADAVLLTEVYAAGEAPIVAADGRSLARALRVAGKVEPCSWTTWPSCRASDRQARDGDVVMCMGAGSIGGVPRKWLNCYKN
jgi:UDP-N-acetylmuramate--alanine ligase